MKATSWATGEGDFEPGEVNPRGWGQVDFDVLFGNDCSGYTTGCQCQYCLLAFENDQRPAIAKIRDSHQARLEHRKNASVSSPSTPLCCSKPVARLPPRVSHLSREFDIVTMTSTNETIKDSGNSKDWLRTFSEGLQKVEVGGDCEEWEGRLIWAAVSRDDFSIYAESWEPIGSKMAKYIPASHYPSRHHSGYRAPFIDVGLGSSLGFFWALQIDWNIQFSAAVVTSIAYWADMASGVDAPVGQLAEIFDVLPSLAQACATGHDDNLSPMKALAMEYLRTPTIERLPGGMPSIRNIWLSRLADVGARESCVLMTGCPSAFSNDRNGDNTRCLVAWGVIHDLFDLPRDLASGNRVNGVLWALFAGVSGRDILSWLRETIATASEQDSCAAKLLLCTAFVHITNPRWAVNGLALEKLSEWPKAFKPPNSNNGKLPLFSLEDGSWTNTTSSVCHCVSTAQSKALGEAAKDGLGGSTPGFQGASQRLQAHTIGLSALVSQDWVTLISLSRCAWKSFLDDLFAITSWVDGR